MIKKSYGGGISSDDKSEISTKDNNTTDFAKKNQI